MRLNDAKMRQKQNLLRKPDKKQRSSRVGRQINRNVNRNNYGYVSRMSEYYFGASNGDFRGPDSVWNFHDGEEWSFGGGALSLLLLAMWAGNYDEYNGDDDDDDSSINNHDDDGGGGGDDGNDDDDVM